MFKNVFALVVFSSALVACSGKETEVEVSEAADSAIAAAGGLCLDAGPQTPRDISSVLGLNTVSFEMAPPAAELNLCNIHTHTNAEHKGPGFSVFVNDTDAGGYACNETADLTDAELAPLDGAFKGAKPGDTIEVHWVHSSCPVTPGEGLGSCLTESCTDPLLRVEAQTFLVVNDRSAADFTDFGYGNTVLSGFHQAKAIPTGTGDPVEFRGSTTGPSYNQSNCSPFKVTWSVRPMCMKVDMASLHLWAESGNVFNEKKSHGVRQLVTAPELLSPIE
ncbi:MAG: cadmium carbonic anhydrase [Gammaproteobacteria bacterium]|nr:cadmium carbonic anhydrase [Gammaproteobacteria bacterium]